MENLLKKLLLNYFHSQTQHLLFIRAKIYCAQNILTQIELHCPHNNFSLSLSLKWAATLKELNEMLSVKGNIIKIQTDVFFSCYGEKNSKLFLSKAKSCKVSACLHSVYSTFGSTTELPR